MSIYSKEIEMSLHLNKKSRIHLFSSRQYFLTKVEIFCLSVHKQIDQRHFFCYNFFRKYEIFALHRVTNLSSKNRKNTASLGFY